MCDNKLESVIPRLFPAFTCSIIFIFCYFSTKNTCSSAYFKNNFFLNNSNFIVSYIHNHNVQRNRQHIKHIRLYNCMTLTTCQVT